MKVNLKITVGISNSGKSTYSHQQWLDNPNDVVLVNRDNIRLTLFGYTDDTISDYYKRKDLNKLEKQVTQYENVLIKEGLSANKTVIVDATHLKAEYIERFRFWNVPTEIVYFDIDLQDAIDRDSLRTRSVGEEVIKRQFEQYKQLNKNIKIDAVEPVNGIHNKDLSKVNIFDIDGTIAQMVNRSPYDWKRCNEDLPIYSILQFITKDSIIVSGRDSCCRKETKDWLIQHLGFLPKLYMRQENDFRADWIIKEEIWREIAKSYYINVLFDDREQVLLRMRSLGLKGIQCEYNNF